MIVQLDKDIWFPDPRNGEEDGLFAIGGDLSPERLILAYSYGIFPWYAFKYYKQIHWYCPMDRFVIFPQKIHISHSMRTLINSNRYKITVNECFDEVIRNCSSLRIDEPGAWLGDKMIKAYTELHRQGFVVSVEVWDEERLVGGLYGINLGKNFFGESMFSLEPSASKMALIGLAKLMQNDGGIIDCQFETAHLKSMGGEHIPYDEYLKLLGNELKPLNEE